MAPVEEKPETIAPNGEKKDKDVVVSDKKKTVKDEEELSEEDQHLKEELEMLVERLTESKVDLYSKSLENLETFIKESTSSMTAVPKPLKFLRPFYPTLVELYENPNWAGNSQELKLKLSDILSVLGMTYSIEDGKQYVRECLKYRLKSNIDESIGNWGHEYLRHLALEIGEEYEEILEYSLSYKANEEEQEEEQDGKSEAATHDEDQMNVDESTKEDSETAKDEEATTKVEYNIETLEKNEKLKAQLIELSLVIVPHFLKNNTEAEAIDLLLEVEQIEKLPQFIDKNTFNRVCNYMISCVPLLAPPDDVSFLQTAFTIYLSMNQLTQALILAIKLGNEDLIQSVFDATNDELIHKQLGFILGRQNSCFKVEDEAVQECISNVKINKYFKYLVGELNLLQPKVPEDIYKSHLDSSMNGGLLSGNGKLESASQNLASAFASAFLNCGFGSEKLINDEKWIYKTKEEGMLSTTASLGLIHLWDNEEGLQVLNEYLYNSQNEIKAGALLGMGISSTSVHDEVDSTLLLLQDYITSDTKDKETIKAAINGIGIAFAGSENEEVLNLLLPLVSDSTYAIEIQCLAALALGHVFVGTCNGDITSSILQSLLEKEFDDFTNNKWIRFISLGLGLLYMGKYEQVDDVLETIEAIEHPIAKTLKVLVNICSYAGTGNVLQIQSLLQMCTIQPKTEKEEEEKKDTEEPMETDAAAATTDAPAEVTVNPDADADADAATGTESNEAETPAEEEEDDEPKDDEAQGYAVLGLALIAMGEEVGQAMSLRHFGHLMHYGNPLIKRAVPLAMGLVSCSSASMNVYETLSRYSHDNDLEVAMNAIFGMGLVGAGTNNARLAQLLRQLAGYYSNEQRTLFMTRISQGLVHLGKGTLTLNPFNTDRQILSKVSLASLLTVCVTLLEPTSFILGSSSHQLATDSNLLYYLTPSIHAKMLVTVDENLEPIKVNVRVGQAVDTVGQAGKPKSITGWVTHLTPVLLGHGERAELENDEYISLSSSLEGVVILKKNPDYMDLE